MKAAVASADGSSGGARAATPRSALVHAAARSEELLVRLRELGIDAASPIGGGSLARALDDGPVDVVFVAPDCWDRNAAGQSPGSSCRPWVVAVVETADVSTVLPRIGVDLDDALLAPFSAIDVELCLARVGRRPRVAAEGFEVPEIIGATAGMKKVCRTIDRIAGRNVAVLISGESGTGKEIVARVIHARSRPRGPFVAVNCGAIPSTLLESELFGHVRGAFTDAVRDKLGQFAAADGGTLLLDEIGELAPEMQVKLLRVLQTGEVCPVGSTSPTTVDVRLVAATHRRLQEEVEVGRFREDLYHRLAVVEIPLPPLRERPEDIDALVDHFVELYGAKHGCARLTIGEPVRAELRVRRWPGNVRELANAVERFIVLGELDVGGAPSPAELALSAEVGPAGAATEPGAAPDAADRDGELNLKTATRALERELVGKALVQAGGNRAKAAKLLGISARGLLYKIKEHGL